jgi:hypothetical protein
MVFISRKCAKLPVQNYVPGVVMSDMAGDIMTSEGASER